MLHELEIENFRCFEKLTAKPLGRVNLLVGKNNSGKTAFLDAVEMLTRKGPAPWLPGLLRRREYTEQTVKDPQTGVLSHEWAVYPAALFRGHQVSRRLGLRICSSGLRVYVAVDQDPSPRDGFFLICEGTGGFDDTHTMTSDGAIRLIADSSLAIPSPAQTVLYLPTERASISALSPLWDEAQAGDEDALVHETLRYIEPRVDRLFVRGDGVNRNFWVRLKGQKELVRLGSLGDGMHHMLSIVLHLVNAKDKYLLVDEIDTGLHYTVLSKMWKMVIESARRLNIQVFATTHSMDCILALAEVHQQLELTPEDLMVHRLVAGMDKTQTYQPNDLVSVAQFQGEVR